MQIPIELSLRQTESGIRALLERLLETALEQDLVADGVIAESAASQGILENPRGDCRGAALFGLDKARRRGTGQPVSRVADFIIRATAGVTERRFQP